jgi:protein-S-isoprenylcysteine O-methyltransferase
MAADPHLFIWIIYALWVALVVYLTVAAIGVKRQLEEHLGQSIGLLFAIVAAFALPHLPIFSFVNFAPVNAVASTVGVILCVAGMAFLVWGRQHLGTNWSQTATPILGDLFLWRVGAEDRLMERQFPNKSPTIRGGRKR